MKNQHLRQISVRTTPEAEEAVAGLLGTLFGLSSSTYHDAETGIATVTVYVQSEAPLSHKVRKDISAGLKQIKNCGLNIGPGRIVTAKLRPQDWAESWKRHFKPIEIGGALLIKPGWSRRKPRKRQVVIVIDPGLSFGTGHHPTTEFCLSEIIRSADSHVRANSPYAIKSSVAVRTGPRRLSGPRSFLDLGTGSGILAITAAKLGYSPVHAVDFDAEAVRTARRNARKNRIEQKLNIRRGDVTEFPVCPRHQRHGYDLVCANLTSDLLIGQRRRIAAQLNCSGTLVLAGILSAEFARVQSAYESLGMKLIARRDGMEWRSGSFRYRNKTFERRQ